MRAFPIHETLYDLFRAAEEGISARLRTRGWPHLGRAQMATLEVLDGERTTVSALARRLDVTRQAAHQTVKQLDTLGFISRADAADSDGVRWITLSDSGRHLVPELAEAIRQTERKLEERLGVGRMWALRKVFDHLGADKLDLGPT
jgi:DNA-binding MarR family transcriptional regulator